MIECIHFDVVGELDDVIARDIDLRMYSDVLVEVTNKNKHFYLVKCRSTKCFQPVSDTFKKISTKTDFGCLAEKTTRTTWTDTILK